MSDVLIGCPNCNVAIGTLERKGVHDRIITINNLECVDKDTSLFACIHCHTEFKMELTLTMLSPKEINVRV